MSQLINKIRKENKEKVWKENGEADNQCLECEERIRRRVTINQCKRLFDCPFNTKQ